MSYTESLTREKLVFRLRGGRGRKRVSFTKDTVDNEHQNKKKSKSCCIYHKNQECENEKEPK